MCVSGRCWLFPAGSAGDAAKDFLDNVSKQADAAKESASKQAEAVKQSAAAAVEDLKSQVRPVLASRQRACLAPSATACCTWQRSTDCLGVAGTW